MVTSLNPIPAARRIAWAATGCLILTGCGGPAAPDPDFGLELLRSEATDQVDSLPTPRVEVGTGRVIIEAVFGLGGSGYTLAPTGTVEEGVVDMLVTARLPSETMGLTVLTRYAYRLTSPPLAPGTYRIRLSQGIEAEGAPEVVLDTTMVVGPPIT